MKTIFAPIKDDQSEHVFAKNTIHKPLHWRIRWAIGAVIGYAFWSLRRRGGQYIPVACAFLLLVCTAQTIGTLHDIASTQTRQKIAQSWRGPYDLLVRSPASMSQIERTTNWIDPQSALESYGGISQQQAVAIRSLPHILAITPYANVGWQSIAVQVPIWLPAQGIYRISTTWLDQKLSVGDSATYVEVTDLVHLTTEPPINSPVLNYIIASKNNVPVMFTLSIPAIQAMIGIPLEQQSALARSLLTGTTNNLPLHFAIHVEKLLGDKTALTSCMQRANCWQAQTVRQGTATYQPIGTQLLRFSPTIFTATTQQITDGNVTVNAIGTDLQGSLYRLPLAEHVAISDIVLPSNDTLLSNRTILPLSGPEHLPFLPNAVKFISLERACAINGTNCYSGMFIRLSGVERYNQRSLALLQSVAATISARTGLHVDILDGSSLRNVGVSASGAHNNAVIQTTWREVGVAVQIVHGLDTLQEMLLLLCSIVCLMTIGIAGTLVGNGRSKDAALLQLLGWHSSTIVSSLLVDALLLCLPGCMLAAIFILIATHIWQSSTSVALLWLLLGTGVAIYGCALVAIGASNDLANAGSRKTLGMMLEATSCRGHNSLRSGSAPQAIPGRNELWPLQPSNAMVHVLMCAKKTRPRRINKQLLQSKVIAPLANFSAVVVAVFLIAIEYLLVTSFNQILVVTVLGNQVRTALEASQLFLLALMLIAALLTVALCTLLLIRGKRDEIILLNLLGWERRAVLLRLLWSSWRPALISGEIAVILALGMVTIVGALPSVWVSLSTLFVGPLMGVLLTTVAALGPIWFETKRVFVWR